MASLFSDVELGPGYQAEWFLPGTQADCLAVISRAIELSPPRCATCSAVRGHYRISIWRPQPRGIAWMMGRPPKNDGYLSLVPAADGSRLLVDLPGYVWADFEATWRAILAELRQSHYLPDLEDQSDDEAKASPYVDRDAEIYRLFTVGDETGQKLKRSQLASRYRMGIENVKRILREQRRKLEGAV